MAQNTTRCSDQDFVFIIFFFLDTAVTKGRSTAKADSETFEYKKIVSWAAAAISETLMEDKRHEEVKVSTKMQETAAQKTQNKGLRREKTLKSWAQRSVSMDQVGSPSLCDESSPLQNICPATLLREHCESSRDHSIKHLRLPQSTLPYPSGKHYCQRLRKFII